jgi:hypothetical protein
MHVRCPEFAGDLKSAGYPVMADGRRCDCVRVSVNGLHALISARPHAPLIGRGCRVPFISAILSSRVADTLCFVAIVLLMYASFSA